AKALDPQDTISNPANSPNFSPTLSIAATQAGVILGTAAYMSPEQAKGKSVDRRADIWAFGCVLYEMLTGQQTFKGESISDTLAAVIRDAPNFERLSATTPRTIHTLLSRCLAKDLRHRLQAIGEARIAIEGYLANPTAEESASASPAQISQVQAQSPSRKLVAAVVLVSSLMLGIGLISGWWLKGRVEIVSSSWSGERLGGPTVAMGSRISPDGRTLAFQAMIDNLTQVAVMDTESGDWTVLTKNRSRGYITELNWSPDGSQIYFDRLFSVPHGIYTVSRFGGDERLVLEDAMGPEALPDGSLLVVKVNKNRDFQLYRFWPENGRLEALDALFANTSDLCPPNRAFHDGKEAVFFGSTLEQDKSDISPHLYVIDLTTGKTRRLAPQLDLRLNSSLSLFPIAMSIDDQSVFVQMAAGDLHRVISIPRRGTGPVQTLFTVTMQIDFMDVDKDGNIYLDQADRPIEALRFSPPGGTPEVPVGPGNASSHQFTPLQLEDGRIVLSSAVAGRSRLLAAKPGGEAAPFIATKEETSLPACKVGRDEVAFLLGPSERAIIAVASTADGRIVRRIEGAPGGHVSDLAASPDGKTLYYVASRSVWAIPVTGGQAHEIAKGDAVAPDPNGKDLIVQLNEEEGIRLLRVPLSGGEMKPILFQSPFRLTSVELSPNAIGKDGRALLSITPPDAWFYGTGILDLRNGKMERIPLNFTGDILAPGWQDDGRILSSGWPFKSTIWRFSQRATAKN
ncbi:MAG TPA: protein kinase, partial [Terriglobia bacterium]|nr:protein kinase [Terriglobia bacterium]